MDEEPSSRKTQDRAAFPATRWSLVLAARRGAAPQAVRALEELCQDYWFPLYAYLRREGHARPDAEDITQAFFQHLLAGGTIQSARQERGRLRSFLLGALKRYLVDHTRHHGATKRGGQAEFITIHVEEGDDRSEQEQEWLVDAANPEAAFHLAWARDLLRRVTQSVRRTYETAGRAQVFKTLEDHLEWNARGMSYTNAAVELDVSEATVRVQVFRMRQLFRQRLEAEVAQTVASPEEVKEELDSLFAVLAR